MEVKLVLSIGLLIPLLVYCIYLIKGLGYFNYFDIEKDNEYREWVKEKGTRVVIFATFGIIVMITIWIWGMLNLG